MNKKLDFLGIFISATMVITIIFAIAMAISGFWQDDEQNNITNVEFVGQYSLDGENWNALNSTRQLGLINKDYIILKGHLSEAVTKEKSLHILLQSQNIRISCGNNILNSNNESIKGGRVFAHKWIDNGNILINTDDNIEITVAARNANIIARKLLESLCIGDTMSLFRAELLEHSVQIIVGIIMLCLGLALSITVVTISVTNGEISRGFIWCGGLLMAGGLCTIIDYNYIGFLFPNLGMLNIVDYLTQIFICNFLILYLCSYIVNKRMKRIFRWLILACFSTVALFFLLNYFAKMDMSGYTFAQMIIYAVVILLMFIVLIFDKKERTKEAKYLVISGLILSLFIVAEMIHFYMTGEYWIVVFQTGLLLFAIMQFCFLIKEASDSLKKIKEAQEIENKLWQMRISIMLSQIQPHFLYNSLNTICALCRSNPKMAEDATTKLAFFLRANMDSLTETNNIAFDQELQHTKNYLDLEKIRFGDRLNVEFDLQITDFYLPTLTLQPIVENAVRYGVTKRDNGGTVKIETMEEENYYKIVVSDDGVGFSPMEKKEDGRTHIGLSNVKDRIANMCGGTLVIKSVLDVGTVATITIPKDYNGGACKKTIVRNH